MARIHTNAPAAARTLGVKIVGLLRPRTAVPAPAAGSRHKSPTLRAAGRPSGLEHRSRRLPIRFPTRRSCVGNSLFAGVFAVRRAVWQLLLRLRHPRPRGAPRGRAPRLGLDWKTLVGNLSNSRSGTYRTSDLRPVHIVARHLHPRHSMSKETAEGLRERGGRSI